MKTKKSKRGTDEKRSGCLRNSDSMLCTILFFANALIFSAFATRERRNCYPPADEHSPQNIRDSDVLEPEKMNRVTSEKTNSANDEG